MKKTWYIVKVIRVVETKTHTYEEEVFESEYEAEPNEYESVACAHALSIAYHGCSDN